MRSLSHYGLAIHTASPDLGLAISNFAGDSRHQVWNLGRDLSTHLHVHLAEFLQPQSWQDLAFLAVVKGPGGFTGTRMGVVTARTLAQQLEIPLFAISTLAAIAWSKQDQTSEASVIAVEMRAQREELFVAIYQVNSNGQGLTTLLPDRVMTQEKWQHTLQNQTNPYQLITVAGGLGYCVTALLELAHCEWIQGKRPHWSEALPFYGQHPVEV